MYLKEDTQFISGYKDIKQYSYHNSDDDTFHDIIDINNPVSPASASANANANASANSNANATNANTNTNTNNDEQEMTQLHTISNNKCLFYTFFFGFIGYLIYYLIKDA